MSGNELNNEVDKQLRSEVENLVDELRVMNQDGLDMYKESNISGNTYADQDEYHEYFEKKKEEAQKKCNH